MITMVFVLGSQSALALSFTPSIDLSVLGDLYLLPASSDYNNGQLHGRFKLLGQDETKKIYMDLGAGGLVGEQAENYFILPQVYAQVELSDSVSVSGGRIIKSFSVMDDYWMLGDVAPLFRWDAARPETQGIPGVFVELKPNKNIQLDLMASYLFLPTQGPSYSLADGKLTSGNPWFSRPVDILEVSGIPYDLQFTVNTPEVSDVIFKPSYGAVLTLKTEDDMYWMRGGYFIKQRNELALPFEGVINLATKTGDIDIFPQVTEHKIATADIGARFEKWSISSSMIYESDVDFPVQANWIYPDFSDQYKVGLNLLWQANAFHTFEAGALKTYNNTVRVLGLSGAGSLDIYSFRNQYDNAVDLRWTAVFSPRQHGFLFKTKVRYAYDYEVETSLVSLDFIYKPFAQLNFFTRADFFGGERSTTDVYNNLMVNYLDKDRVQAGVQYAF